MRVKLTETDEELNGILELQKLNLEEQLSKEEIHSQGFVTVIHDFDLLKAMNDEEQSIIAVAGGKVVGYCLAMKEKFGSTIDVLKPFYKFLNTLNLDGKPLMQYGTIEVGQACIDKDYRGQKLLDLMYSKYQQHFSQRYKLAVTEIVQRNKRSLNAHKRIGFKTIASYTAPNKESWDVVVWDWRDKCKT